MDVTDVLRDRMQTPAGFQRMVSVSLLLHGVLVIGVLFAPKGLLSPRPEAPRMVMTISLGGGGSGPQTGGLTAIGGRPVQVQTPPEEKPKREAVRAPAAKQPEMTVPAKSAKASAKTAPAPVVKQAPDEARGRTPTKGAEVRPGTAIAETGAKGEGFGLSSGGGPGSGSRLDVGDFCCPAYLSTMTTRIYGNWDQHLGATGVVVVRFTLERDGKITGLKVERSSGNPLLDNAAERAVLLTKQLPALPAEYTNPTLGVHLNFNY